METDATGTLIITFNGDSNNVTYDLDFNNVPVPTAAHIHINAGPDQNGSVAIPLWMGNFAPDASAGPVSGRVASNAVAAAAFVGPLEVSSAAWRTLSGDVQQAKVKQVLLCS